jgi:uncharacterized membrane protein YgcG
VVTGLATAGLLLASCAKRPAVFVDDEADLLSETAEASVTSWHAALLRQYDIDYRVLTIKHSGDLSAFAVRHFEHVGVGSLSSTGRGLLLVADAGGERVRLEVSRELEGVFVDSFVSFIEREQMAPFFAVGRVGDGIVAASELIAGRAEEAIAASAFDERAAAATSAGAGAESSADIGDGYEPPIAAHPLGGEAASSPLDTVSAYLAAMAARDGSPDLDLYTPATREMMAGHVVTRGQMANLVRTYLACAQSRVREQDDYAVVDYPGDPGACSPWFLERGADGRWRLDLLTMQRAVRFDTQNRWRIAVPEALGAYRFAFEG